MFEWKEKASNAILLDDNVGGKGKCFRAKFLQPGLVKYSFGVCLLNKEVIDRFVYQFEGCPVIIDHKDVTTESAKDDRVGVISKVWFSEADSWYWCEGVIFEQEALNLIDKGFNISCQYEITEYSENRENKLHNGNEYDKTILNGRPEHLAIVENPRYENAMIAVNALDLTAGNEDGSWFSTEKGVHIHLEEGQTKEEALKQRFGKKEESDFEEAPEELKKEDTKEYKSLEKQRDGLMQQVQGLKKRLETATTKDAKEAIQRGIDARKERINKIEDEMIKEKKKVKNSIIEAINEIKEIPMFKNLFKKEKKMEKEEMKALFMECLTELTAANEAEKKEEVKEEEKEAENKCKNEEPDYKKLYEDLKAKMEAANEEKEKEEEKAEDKKEAKNSIDEQMAMFCKEVETGKSDYISRAKAIELGSELF